MRKTHWRASTSLTVLVIAGAATLAAVQAPSDPPPFRAYDPGQDDRDARPNDLVALQDDLYLLDGSLAAQSRLHPRFLEFQRRADEIRHDVSALADRLSQDRRSANRREEERYGANYRILPALVSEIRALRYRVGSLREEIENAQARRWGSPDLLIPTGTEIEVMLDAVVLRPDRPSPSRVAS